MTYLLFNKKTEKLTVLGKDENRAREVYKNMDHESERLFETSKYHCNEIHFD